MSDIVKNVKDSNTDLIIFLSTNHTNLIETLDKETAVFRPPLVTIMMGDNTDSVDLRLDTNIVSIEHNGGPNKYLLKDIYSIKKGPELSREFGTWSRDAGLSVKMLNVYERRQNLGGIQLRDGILPYAKITKPNFDKNNKVIESGGVFQGCMRFLNSQIIYHHSKIFNLPLLLNM